MKENFNKDVVKAINRMSLLLQEDNEFINSEAKKAFSKYCIVKKDEIIAILGKGDEDYQEINGVKHPFSDAAVVRELLKTKPC